MTIHASAEFWERAIGEIKIEGADLSQNPPDENLKTFCRDCLPKKATVLDLGTGAGRNAQYLAEQGHMVHGLDIAPSAVSLAARRLEMLGLQGTFTQGRFTEIPYPDGFFDAVACIAALDHVTLAGAHEAMVEMRRVLKPGGKMLLTFDPPHRDEEIRGEAVEQEDGSLYFVKGEQKGMLFRRYTDQEIRNLIDEDRIISFTRTEGGDRVLVCA